MKGPWSSTTILMAAGAATSACIAATAVPAEASLMAAAIGDGDDIFKPLRAWLGDSYDHAPALMLGLSVLLLVPVLALAGLVVRRSRPQATSDATVLIRSRRRRSEAVEDAGTEHAKTQTIRPAPAEAWVETEAGDRVAIGSGMVRIGREADNDIRLSDQTVHRYHAIIRRTTDGEVMVTDMSGDDGNGVLVNGAPVGEKRLARGDVINIGRIKLRFDAQRA